MKDENTLVTLRPHKNLLKVYNTYYYYSLNNKGATIRKKFVMILSKYKYLVWKKCIK